MHLDASKGCSSGSPETLKHDSKCTFPVKGQIGRAILIGDSHAGQLAEGFIKAAHNLLLDATIATNAGKPLLSPAGGILKKGESEFVDLVIAEKPSLVVVAQSKDYPLDASTGTWPTRFRAIIEYFRTHKIGVVVVNTSTFVGIEPQECSVIGVAIRKCPADVVVSRPQVEARVSASLEIEEEAIQGTDVVLVNLIDVFCGLRECPTMRDGKWMWRDSSHMSIYASELAPPKLEAAMSSVINGS